MENIWLFAAFTPARRILWGKRGLVWTQGSVHSLPLGYISDPFLPLAVSLSHSVSTTETENSVSPAGDVSMPKSLSCKRVRYFKIWKPEVPFHSVRGAQGSDFRVQRRWEHLDVNLLTGRIRALQSPQKLDFLIEAISLMAASFFPFSNAALTLIVPGEFSLWMPPSPRSPFAYL